MLRIEMLPAAHGDCIWITYGTESKPKHVLIDAGTPGTYKHLEKAVKRRFGASKPHFELFVITHIDADHIGGAVPLLEKAPKLGLTFGDIWFNGWDHIVEKADLLGARQAEIVTETLETQNLPWNRAFGGKAVVIDGKLPEKELAGGATLTLLSPWRRQLHDLIPKWKAELKEAGLLDDQGNRLRPSDVLGGARRAERPTKGKIVMDDLLEEKFESDAAEANGSSIAFLFEQGKRRCIFTGDAHVPVVMKSLAKIRKSGPVAADVVKIAHHGSKGNVSSDLLEKLDCCNYLISTNGSVFHHPDRAGVARIIRNPAGKPTLYFNYDSAINRCWNDAKLMKAEKYAAKFPSDPDAGYVLDL